MLNVLIKKNEGGEELFNEEKLIRSLKKAGASDKNINKIIDDIKGKVFPEITSAEIYEIAFKTLRKIENKSAVKYSLRRSLLSLGPTGFPFEIYVSKLLEHQGYQTTTNQILKGRCVDHEIDVIAWDSKNLLFIESKFHNDLHLKTDIKTILYVKARFDDLKDQKFNFSSQIQNPTLPTIITNTKFTGQAITYAKCSGVNLIGWDYPNKGNLYNLIEESGMYPLTSLNSLSKEDKITLLKDGIVDCKNIKEKEHDLIRLGIGKNKIKKILDEVIEVCNI